MELTELYGLLSVLLFVIGLTAVMVRRNLIVILMGVELMLNAANLNFAAVSHKMNAVDGQVAAIFVMVLAVAEVAVALVIMLKVVQVFKTSDVDQLTSLKEE